MCFIDYSLFGMVRKIFWKHCINNRCFLFFYNCQKKEFVLN